MKPKNFPTRKLKRQIEARERKGEIVSDKKEQLEQARRIRTKKHRGD